MTLHVCIAGPASLELLFEEGAQPDDLPAGYPMPTISVLALELARRGHRVTIVTHSPDLQDTYRAAVGGRIEIAVVPRMRARDALTGYRNQRRSLAEEIASAGPDVVHAQWTYEFALAAEDAGRPTLVTAHDDAWRVARHTTKRAYRLVRAGIARGVLRRARIVSVPSEYLRTSLAARTSGLLSVVGSVYSPEAVSLGDPARGERPPVVATVANGFGPLKNVGAAMAAMPLVRQELPAARLRLVGEGMGDGGPAYRHAAKLGLLEGVEFLGPLPYVEALAVMREAAIVLHPSREESFGMTVLESMVLGTPVIGGRSSGNVPALLADGRGQLCDVESPADMAQSVVAGLTDHAAAIARANRARTFALETFDPARIVAEYESLYALAIEDYRKAEGGDR